MNRRKELKFLVNESMLEIVRNRIEPIMHLDEHQMGDSYNIRSIYFDSPENKCMLDNFAGVDDRCKYRIRTYDCNPDVINMEIKHRYRDTISKSSSRISKECLESIISGEFDALSIMNQGLSEQELPDGQNTIDIGENAAHDFALKLTAENYKPKCVVEYDRCAYVYDACNVRVTFDRNIRTFNTFENFFEKNVTSQLILPQGAHVLEIKYDEFLPSFFESLLDDRHLRRCGFSKYVRCMEV